MMHFYPNERLAIFIDGANLYATAKALGFDIDYKRLLALFRTKGQLVRALYYTAIAEDQEYTSIRPLVDWLDYNGYTMVTKPTKEFTDALGRRKVKGNMDIELTVDAMRLVEHLDHMVLFTGDGDFRALVAMRWLRSQEKADRVNARVADKLVIALPRELTAQQRVELLWGFAEDLSQGRASWFAAIHAKGKDRDNPHAHLLVRDRDVRTGERVVMFSAGQKEAAQRAAKGLKVPTTLRQIREMWARHANRALERAGRSERIDHRRLVDQGQYRLAQVHEGPNVRAMHARGVRPESRQRVMRNPAMRKKGAPKTRVVKFEDIDLGRTRVEYNLSLKDAPPLSLSEIHAMRTRLPSLRASTAWTPTRGRTR